MKTNKQILLMLALALPLGAFAEDNNGEEVSCLEFAEGTIQSEHTLMQVQTGLLRETLFAKNNLNDPKTLKYAINEIGLKELNQLITENVNPVKGDAYIDGLLEDNRIQPENPETVALYFDPADEPTTNPILGQMLAEIFKRGASVKVGECFAFDIHVGTKEHSQALVLKLVVDKKDTWLFEISELELTSIDPFAMDPGSFVKAAMMDVLKAYLGINYLNTIILGGGTLAAEVIGVVLLKDYLPEFIYDDISGPVVLTTSGLAALYGVYKDVKNQLRNPMEHIKYTTIIATALLAMDYLTNYYPYYSDTSEADEVVPAHGEEL